MKSYKKIILTLLVALCGLGVADAKIFRFGVKAGLNLNSISFNDAAKTFGKDNHCGYTVGVMGEFNLPLVGLGLDLSAMYTRMNSELTDIDEDGDKETGNFGKNFLEIPLNVKYKISLPVVGSIVAPYVYTGPSFAFALGKHTLGDIKSKTCQTAWNVGIGVELFKHLQVQGSYGFGMNNIVKFVDKSDELHPVEVKAKNNYWTVTAAYLF